MSPNRSSNTPLRLPWFFCPYINSPPKAKKIMSEMCTCTLPQGAVHKLHNCGGFVRTLKSDARYFWGNQLFDRMPTTCIYLLQESAKRRTHKQQKDNESDLVIDKFRNLNHDIETFKILWQSLRCFTHESRGGRGAVWAVPDYCTKKDFWTTLGILNWHILIYFCACVFHRFQISPSQLQSRLGVTRTSGQYFATIADNCSTQFSFVCNSEIPLSKLHKLSP